MLNIILASASPRRRELLTMLGLNFTVMPAMSEEEPVKGAAPEAAVCDISLAKAKDVSKLCSDTDIIIAADTIVSLDTDILVKPVDEEDAFKMLSSLSGRVHNVYTGVVLIKGNTQIVEYERTSVRFRKLKKREILAYIETGEPMDKAGAYGVQGIGSLFVEGIEGDFFNVMGLPLHRLSKMLERVGVRLI